MDMRDIPSGSLLIRQAKREEWQDAMALAWKTFLKFESEDYTPQGVKSFQDFITDSTLYRMFITGSYELFLALYGRRIAGMLSLRNVSHVSLLFVDEAFHKKGIGRMLVEYVCRYLKEEAGRDALTVNASPYGLGFYERVGFISQGPAVSQSGIIYTPMELKINNV